MFSKVWPTQDTHRYFQYLHQVGYGEKLMGETFFFHKYFLLLASPRLFLSSNYFNDGGLLAVQFWTFKHQKIYLCFQLKTHSIHVDLWTVFRVGTELIYLADAYEYYYGEHREEGQELIREYCEIKTHLRVKIEHPKPDPDVEAQQTSLSKVSIPSVFLSGEQRGHSAIILTYIP